jgi:hypothetical protein
MLSTFDCKLDAHFLLSATRFKYGWNVDACCIRGRPQCTHSSGNTNTAHVSILHVFQLDSTACQGVEVLCHHYLFDRDCHGCVRGQGADSARGSDRDNL